MLQKEFQPQRALRFALLVLLLSAVAPWKTYSQSFTVDGLGYSVNSDGVSVTVTGTAHNMAIDGESFENGIPSDWVTIDADGDGYNWEVATWANHSGNSGVTSASYLFGGIGALTPDNYLASGQVNFTASSSIRFYACAYSSTYAAEHFGVAVSTGSQTDAANYTTVAEWTMTAKGNGSPQGVRNSRTKGSWYEYTVDLSSYAGQTGFVAIRHFGCTDKLYLGVDDVFIVEDDSVFAPSDFIIPESVSFEGVTYAVTAIGNRAFYDCGRMVSIEIPSSVVSIGNYAFYNCDGLTSIEIPNSVVSIGNYAFSRCSGLTSVILPDSLAAIADHVFESCEGLTSIEIPSSVTYIGSAAFESCNSLMSIEIPNSVTYIGIYAFSYCRKIASLTVLADNPPALGNNAFFYDDVEAIPLYVPCGSVEAYTDANWGDFSNIYGLCGGTIAVTAVPTEGGTATGAGYYEAGARCTLSATANEGYTFIYWTKDGAVVSSDPNYSFMVVEDASCEAHFSLLGEWNLPIQFADANVKAICVANWDTDGDGELSYAEAAAVTELGTAFRYNDSIYSFDELQYFVGLTSVGYEAFYHCVNLTSVTIPSSVVFTGSYAFSFCSSLTSVEIPNSVTYIAAGTFGSCSSLLSIEIPNSVTSIGISAFASCSSLTSIEIPNSVVFFDINVFFGCRGLGQIVVDPGNPVYDSRENCNAIIETNTNTVVAGCKYTVIPNSVTSIGNNAFSSCYGMASIEIPNSVTSIGESAFKNCIDLSYLIIPNSVTSIGGSAFYGCSSLTTMMVMADNPPSLLGGNVFYDVNKSIPVYVPGASVDTYQHAEGWCEFTNYLSATAFDSGEIIVMVDPAEGGVVTGAGYYEGGEICTLTATPNPGYRFVNWTKDGVEISNLETYSFCVLGDAVFVANFEKGLIIGSGTATDMYLPSYSLYEYALSQQIYTSDEIGCSGNINSIAFYNTGATKTRSYDVYMVSTEKTVFESTSDWVVVTESDLVFSGQVIMNANDWTELQFSTPFQYDGMSNIVLVVDDNSGSWTSSPHMTCRVFDAQGTQAIRVYSADTNYNPYNPSGYSGTLRSVKNQIKLGVTPSTVTQTIDLSAGWNWFSPYIEAEDPVELLQMLEAALGANAEQIQSSETYTEYYDGGWWGELDEEGITSDQTYWIYATTDCTVELEGTPVNTEGVEITINPGWNWIGFPSAVELDVNDALGGFEAEDGDQLQGEDIYTEYYGGWWGELETLIPGEGYWYYSSSSETKALVFSTAAKGKTLVLRGKRKE